MDVMAESKTIEREIEIAARPETIWRMLVDRKAIGPEKLDRVGT